METRYQPWILLSSSSGETFRALYKQLSLPAQKSLLGFFSDRNCPALTVAREVTQAPVTEFPKKEFEARLLEWFKSEAPESGAILLCGFFGILSEDFLKNCPWPIINTHPSLLPAFPGLEKRVHALAAEQVAISGFTVHMVTEELDGGPILFQQPVWLDPRWSPEEARLAVRAAEQKFLPRAWERLLQHEIRSADRYAKSRELRARLEMYESGFVEKV